MISGSGSEQTARAGGHMSPADVQQRPDHRTRFLWGNATCAFLHVTALGGPDVAA
jgi:hypothetical protein